MDCETLAGQLTNFLEGDLLEHEEMAAITHLSSCDSCDLVLAGTRKTIQLARQHGRARLSDQDRLRILGSVINEVGE